MSHLLSTYRVLILAVLISLVSCSKSVKPPAERTTSSTEKAAPAGPKTFASPAEAGAALLAAAQSGGRDAWLAIFGPDGADVLFTGDPAQDRTNMRDFVTAYSRMNRWGQIKAGGETLYIGPDNYAFPIPLGQDASGRWSFDTAAGKDEILARRIGQDELTAITASEAAANAQKHGQPASTAWRLRESGGFQHAAITRRFSKVITIGCPPSRKAVSPFSPTPRNTGTRES